MALTAIQNKLGLSDKAADRERQLDDAIADSFPASDPVSLAQPHTQYEKGLARSGTSMTTMMLVGGGLLALIALIAFRR